MQKFAVIRTTAHTTVSLRKFSLLKKEILSSISGTNRTAKSRRTVSRSISSPAHRARLRAYVTETTGPVLFVEQVESFFGVVPSRWSICAWAVFSRLVGSAPYVIVV